MLRPACSANVCSAVSETTPPVLQDTYGKRDTVKWWVRWRVFYLACSELFAFRGGSSWGVGHYLFQNKTPVARR